MEAVTPIPKIRAGNKFTFVWAIERGGVAEDLTAPTITDLKLTVCVGGLCAERVEVPFTIVDTNKIQSSHLYERTGTYNLELTYKKSGVENEIDIEAFKIVARSAEASDSSDFAVSSDMAIGFKGEKGDAFTYDDFTPEQIAELQQPATYAALLANEKAGLADAAATNANTKAILANDAALLANEKAGLANTAATNANTKATLANNAALLANEKAGLADEAATNADNARLAIQDDLTLKANHGYESNPKTLKEVDDELDKIAGEVNLLDAVQGAKIRDIENVLSTANLNQSAQLSVSGVSPLSLPKNAANGWMEVKLEGLTADVGGVITNFEPTGRVRSVDASGVNPTHLYLTAPELRSNGTVKDEIRKGSNGYELVKRVGVGNSNGEIVVDGGFADTTKWTVTGGYSAVSDGTLKIIAGAGVASSATQNKNTIAGKIYQYSIKVNSLTGILYIRLGLTIIGAVDQSNIVNGYVRGFFVSTGNNSFIQIIKEVGIDVSAELDDFSIIEYNANEGAATGTIGTVIGSNVHYTLATPTITPIAHAGLLNSNSNGTIYHEPIIADAGVYSDKMDILLTDYSITSIEEIIKHENGVDTYLNIASAVIASDGLSFTHHDLADGDLVLFTYAYDKESTNGNITATFYDSNVVKIDTVTGTAYKIEDVITNGVLTRTLTEV